MFSSPRPNHIVSENGVSVEALGLTGIEYREGERKTSLRGQMFRAVMLMLLTLTMFAGNALGVLYRETRGPGRNDNRFSFGTYLDNTGVSDKVTDLKNGYDCLDRACFMAETNEFGVRDGTVLRLLEQSEVSFGAAVSASTTEPFSIMGLAYIHEIRGECNRALTVVNGGIDKYPSNSILLCCRGKLLANSGRIEESMSSYRAAITSQPQVPFPYQGLVDNLITTHRLDEAMRVCAEALVRWPHDELIADFSIKALLCQGKYVEASTKCEAFLAAHPIWDRLLYRRAQISVSRGDVERGIKELNEVIRLDPYFADAYNELANAWLRLGERGKALEWYEAGLRVYPRCSIIHANLGEFHAKGKEYEQACVWLKKALELSPTDERICDRLASAYLENGDVNTAYSVCTNALAVMPWAWSLHFQISECLGRLGKRDESLRYAETGRRLGQYEADAWFRYGRIQAACGLWGKATDAWGRAVQINEFEPSYVAHRALALYESGRYSESVDVCRLALSRFPDNTELLLTLGQGLVRLGRTEEAAETVVRVSRKVAGADVNRPAVGVAWGMLGQAYFHKERYRDAKNSYAEAGHMDATNTVWFAGEIWSAAMFDRTDAYRLLKEGLIRFPGNCELLVLWGRLAMQEQDPRERESACVALESKKPKNAEICFWSGCLASSLGRTQQALTNWLESVRLKPNWAAPYGEIGRAKARMGDSPQVATTWFEKAVELEPNIAVARSDLGYAYYLAGEHANAVRELEKAVVLDPSSGLAWYNLALTHHALGLYKKAFEEAIKAQQCGYKGDASFLRRLEDLQKSLTK